MTRAEFRAEVREALADPKLTPQQREQRIAAAADEYAAHMIEQHARPAALRGVA